MQPPADVSEYFREEMYQNKYGLHFLLDYDEVWERILHKSYMHRNTFLCGLVGFDSTPRRGKGGDVIYGGNPEKFKKYMIRLLLKAGQMKSEFVFVNAWNEWGEGMYLEPDEKWQFQYLEALKSAKEFVSEYGDVVEASRSDVPYVQEESQNALSIENKRIERYRGYWEILSRWLEVNLRGKNFCAYLNQEQFENIAIYGLGLLGGLLVHEMNVHNVQIAYGIDQDKFKGRKFDFPVYRMQDTLPEADIIIVTVEHVFENIKQQLMEKKSCKIVSLSELLSFAEE